MVPPRHVCLSALKRENTSETNQHMDFQSFDYRVQGFFDQ